MYLIPPFLALSAALTVLAAAAELAGIVEGQDSFQSFIPADKLVFLYASKCCPSSFDYRLYLLILERSALLESYTRKQAQIK
jgi:hypothetical protein